MNKPTTHAIRQRLKELGDDRYVAFQHKLIPTLPAGTVIGVRTPQLRQLAKQLTAEGLAGPFLSQLPHRYFEENQLHAFILSGMKDMEECLRLLEVFLPYVDNWGTCDQLSPAVFARHRPRLLELTRQWLASDRVYTVRFGIGMLLRHFLDEAFSPSHLEWVAAVANDDYYVRMMVAWYFSTALVKQYEAALPFMEGQRLDRWTHNKAIQKAVESYRIAPGRKEHLKTLRRK